MWWLIIGWLTGRGLRNAALPDSVKQQRYDVIQARRAQRHVQRVLTPGQWVVVVLAILFVVGLIAQAFK